MFDIVLANLLTTFAAAVVWTLNFTVYRMEMPRIRDRVGMIVLFALVVTAISAQMGRTLFNYGFISFDWSQVIAAISRWSYLLIGVGLLWNAWAERREER